MAAESVAYQNALSFAKRIVLLCKHLNSEHQEYTLSKQILRSGTSIGANIAEARCGYSRKDFAAKIYIALNRPWQNGPFKHALLGPEQAQLPASLLRRNANLTYCMAEEVAKGVVI